MPRALRLVTLNFWGTEPPLDRRLALAATQLASLAPDVVGLQEVRPLDGQRGPTTAHWLAERIGAPHVLYVPSVRWPDGAFGPESRGGEEGLAIVSRWPLVARRAQAMQAACEEQPGTMAAILGLADAAVEQGCQQVTAEGEVVVAANYNCPGQLVISGSTAGIAKACEALKAAGAKRALPLPVIGRIRDGALLLDLRCLPDDGTLLGALAAR